MRFIHAPKYELDKLILISKIVCSLIHVLIVEVRRSYERLIFPTVSGRLITILGHTSDRTPEYRYIV